jgi:DDE superfamily endonuclease
VHPDAEAIVLVTDNLNTHTPACLYEAFDPGRARRIAARLEWHYTPRHGSWLNMAEIELAALTKQCLDRRIGSMARLRWEVAAWEAERNERMVEVKWRFTTADARIKLRSLYPPIQV